MNIFLFPLLLHQKCATVLVIFLNVILLEKKRKHDMTCVGIGEITDYINTSLSHFVKNLTVHLFT